MGLAARRRGAGTATARARAPAEGLFGLLTAVSDTSLASQGDG